MSYSAAAQAPPPAACGATSPFVVDELADDDGTATPGDCSLREAVLAANAYTGSGVPTVVVGPGVHQLSIGGRNEDAGLTGDLDITGTVAIVASSSPPGDAQSVIIDGGRLDRVLHVHGGAALTIDGVTITNGDATSSSNGGGILVNGNLEMRRSLVGDNIARGGGGLFFSVGSDALVEDSAIVDNVATDDGAGVESVAGRVSSCSVDPDTCPTRLHNVTVSGNIATQNHGGVSFDNNSDGYLNNVTVTKNHANSKTGGLGPGTGGRVFVANTVIGGNTAVVTRDDCDVGIVSLDHNFFETGCNPAAFAANDVTGPDPDLGPLALNGGSTPNHLPNGGSPLIDAGSPTTCEPLDQRGLARGFLCDIGAIDTTSGVLPTCFGLVVTVDLASGGVPTAGDDVVRGTAGNDTIAGLGGNDVICGGSGDDFIVGGPGDDILLGQAGNDTITGNAGADRLLGNAGGDLMIGGSGDDNLAGQGGGDVIGGGRGHDVVDGGFGNDTLSGGSDDDIAISGGPGDDAVNGGGGDDGVVNGDEGNDAVAGNGGKDTVDGGIGDDQVRGGDNDDVVRGGPGDDFVAGNAGIDLCDGGTTAETIGDVAAPNCETVVNVP